MRLLKNCQKLVMLLNLVFLFTLSVSRAQQLSVAVTARACAIAITHAEIERTDILSTGVLVRDSADQVHLITGPYIFQSHHDLLDRLVVALKVRNVEMREILWMGELRIETIDGRPWIHEANETSGYYFSNLRTFGFAVYGRPVQVRNDFNALPISWRAPDFAADHYRPDKVHLVAELNSGGGNLRHTVAQDLSAIQMLVDVVNHIPKYSNPELVKKRVALIISLAAVEKALHYATTKKLVKPEDVNLIERVIKAISTPDEPDIAELKRINFQKLCDQIRALSTDSFHLYTL